MRPADAGAAGAAPDLRDLLARERWLLHQARFAQTVKARFGIAAVTFAFAAVDVLTHPGSRATWPLLMTGPVLTVLVNLAARRVARRRAVRRGHFWALQAYDTLCIGAMAVLLGERGYLALPFYLMITAAYALGLPRMAAVQCALAAAAYPAARLLGLAWQAPATPLAERVGGVLTELAVLVGLGWLALQGPLRFTRRVRRARRALAALEHGDFAARLPTRALDDVGFLGVSFNRTAEALGEAVAALRAEVGERERAEAALRASEARFRSIFEHAAVGIALHDDHGRILEANPAFQRIVGYPLDELRAMRASELSPPEEAAVTREPVRALKAGACDRVAVEKHVRRKDGALRRCELTVTRADAPGGSRGLVGMLQDVTEHRAAQDELVYRAYHDPLTGLANRARFRDRAAEALAGAERAARVAVLLVDLDGFKLVNDTAGPAAGDAVLKAAAHRLLDATRGSDLVARVGGDEFAVLLTNVGGRADAFVVADRIVAALARPMTVHGITATVGASVGVARGGAAPASAAAGPDDVAPVDALLRAADLALHEAKARGRGQYATFEPRMHAAAVERVALEGALRDGIARGEFHLAYQPIVDLATGAAYGVEALVRWRHPVRGAVPPGQFIPLAEETGLVRPLGRWVLEEACRQGARWAADGWAAAGGRPLSVTVNVSGRQLQHAGFVGEVEAALAASGFPAERLVLELTESSVVHHPEAARRRLCALKALGVRVAIDDFGTGHSALSYLRQFPIDVLKIDKSFVDQVAAGGQPAALASAIVALGQALGLRTVAEGVESAEQAAALAAMGCGFAQGYYFGRPVDPAAVEALLGAPAPRAARPPAVAPSLVPA